MEQFGVDLNLRAYDIATNPNSSVIFYNTTIGIYPFVKDGVVYNGGVPQVSRRPIGYEEEKFEREITSLES